MPPDTPSVAPSATGVSGHDTVAIIGAGPTGSALAIRLRQRGIPVVIFDSDKRPPLLVGESLVPAAVPHLETLGVLDKVAHIGVRKPGATLLHGSGERVDFRFRTFGKRAPAHAWNVPRPAFDDVLAARAIALGARRVVGRAQVQAPSRSQQGSWPDSRSQSGPQSGPHSRRGATGSPPRSRTPQNGELELTPATLALAGLSSQPGLVVDATGRARLASRALGLSATRGGRDDIACFAHFTDTDCPVLSDGRILISILDRGWSWCIPLPDRVSVGVVVPRASLADAGGKADAVLHDRIAREPVLRDRLANARRITGVMRYEHYQQVGERAAGQGWVAAGDAFGFVDPMLSPGVFMALESASQIARRVHVCARDARPAFIDAVGYEACMRSWFAGWSDVIETFYDGRMLALQSAARTRRAGTGAVSLHRVAEAVTRRSIAQLVSGANTRSALARSVLAHSCRHLLKDAAIGASASDFAVQGARGAVSDERWIAFGSRPVPTG